MSDPLVTVERLKLAPTLASLSDAVLTELALSASSLIREYVGRELTKETRTERISGHDAKYAILRESPIVSVTSVTSVDEGDGSTVSVVPGDLFINQPCDGAIRLKKTRTIASTLTMFLQDVLYDVVYVGGFEPIPRGIVEAAVLLASLLYSRENQNLTLKSEKLGDYSYTNATAGENEKDPLERVTDLLTPWVDVAAFV